MANINDFSFLKEAGFYKVYSSLEYAMQYYDRDAVICCKCFRDVMEDVIDEILALVDHRSENKSIKDIRTIEYVLMEIKYYDINTIVSELHNMRNLGNVYSHNTSDREPFKDRYTNYCAMLKIGHWMIEFKKELPKYLERYEEEQRRRLREEQQCKKEYEEKQRKKEKRNIILTIGATILTIAGTIIGLKKMNE